MKSLTAIEKLVQEAQTPSDVAGFGKVLLLALGCLSKLCLVSEDQNYWVTILKHLLTWLVLLSFTIGSGLFEQELCLVKNNIIGLLLFGLF